MASISELIDKGPIPFLSGGSELRTGVSGLYFVRTDPWNVILYGGSSEITMKLTLTKNKIEKIHFCVD